MSKASDYGNASASYFLRKAGAEVGIVVKTAHQIWPTEAGRRVDAIFERSDVQGLLAELLLIVTENEGKTEKGE